jgi:D-alanyl-D-alanine carboxypeptidase
MANSNFNPAIDNSDICSPKIKPKQYDYRLDRRIILVNKENPIPSTFEVNIKDIGEYKIDETALSSAEKMIEDAKSQNINLEITSAYRSTEYQQKLYDKSIQSFISQGYSSEEAEELTLEYIAKPGTSEHHTGMALDIVTSSYKELDEGFAETDAAKWLMANSYKYGFILRYPKGKEEITKIQFEPWHYRYVGSSHAKPIFEGDLCLEEYIKKLSPE